MNSHLSDDDAAALAEGGLGGRDREVAEGHLADCEDCRNLILAVQAGLSAASVKIAPPTFSLPAFPWRRHAAAAALLVLAGGVAAWVRFRPLPGPAIPASSSGRTSVVRGVVEGLPWVALSEDLAVELSPGSRISPLPGAGGWRLEAGQAWWTSQGAGPVRLEAAGLALEIGGPAALGVRLVPAPAAAWTDLLLGQVEAAAPEALVEVWVVEGVVKGIADGKSVAVPAGHLWRTGDAAPRRASAAEMASAFAWRESLGRLSDSPPRLLGSVRDDGSGWTFSGPGSLLCTPPPGAAYRLGMALAASGPPAAAGVSCQFEGETAVWELPSSLWDAHPHRVTVEASPVGVRILLDGVLVRSVGRGGFRANQLAVTPGAGLVVWGGAVRVSSASLRLLGSAGAGREGRP